MQSKLSIDEVKILYDKEKLTTSQAALKLGVNQWKLISFMKRNGVARRTAAESNSINYLRQKPTFNLKTNLSGYERKLKHVACALYWGEGAKSLKHCAIDLANSDPKLVVIFLKFLRLVCGIQEKKLRILLYCYSDQNPSELVTYWSYLLNIPGDQFSKPYVRHDFNPEGRKMLKGLVHVRYNDKKLFLVIHKWIEDIKVL